MALIAGLFYLGIALVLAALAVALGLRFLQWFDLAAGLGALEEALCAAGLSFALLGVVAFALGALGWLHRSTALILFLAAALVAGKGWRRLYELTTLIPCIGRRIVHSQVSLLLALAIAGCVALDMLLAMAPVSCYDALVYHFTVPMLGLSHGSEPNLWLIKGFWTGQGHALIELGLALGSDRISMGLILVGGLLTAGALFWLTRHLTSGRWGGFAALAFLLTPMVFWQIGTSGSPDIWMAFFTTLAVMSVNRGLPPGENRWLVLGGVFAGAAAGIKYTGWAIPAGAVIYCLFATRSLYRTLVCGLWSVPAGILPLVRNTYLTGDPFFPFLSRWLTPEHLNSYSFAAMYDSTQTMGFDRSVTGLLGFPLLLTLKGELYGFGHLFGPIVLALAPLLWFSVRKGGLASGAGCVWGVVFLAVAVTSQGARFLLPVFPLALALVLAGVAEVFRRGWPVIQLVCSGSILLALLFGLGSESLYARDFLPVAIGMENREVFLERMAHDYGVVSFINRSLEGRPGKALVFFQPVYYLRIPFLTGDPQISWPMDPDRLTGPQSLLRFFHQQGVRWVVKAPDYPDPFAPALGILENEGMLRPKYSADSMAFDNIRVVGEKVPIHVVILEVVSAP